jgi:hypothetical protein
MSDIGFDHRWDNGMDGWRVSLYDSMRLSHMGRRAKSPAIAITGALSGSCSMVMMSQHNYDGTR